jgi:hypothetical protein
LIVLKPEFLSFLTFVELKTSLEDLNFALEKHEKEQNAKKDNYFLDYMKIETSRSEKLIDILKHNVNKIIKFHQTKRKNVFKNLLANVKLQFAKEENEKKTEDSIPNGNILAIELGAQNLFPNIPLSKEASKFLIDSSIYFLGKAII